ncbi:tail fiber domain-containing protein [Nonlabens xiamenensis]|uniref:tail fiber domain-containing protein n=1 Tax=Nonlabens xiamenensis TaxID=2341043 RepID=UPI000F6074BB|nr:tail fiber domain-containing protein [Nonlabens xiamenensis]
MKPILLFVLFFTVFSSAQVGIGTDVPAESSILHITTSLGDKGLLLPRVNIANLNDQAPITGNMEESLLVYNVNTGTGKGFHFWNGTMWEPLLTPTTAANQGGSDEFWKISGNAGTTAGTDPSSNFLGTTDNVDLVLATNSTQRMFFDTSGQVGIGAGAPDQQLHLQTTANGQGLRIQRGNDFSEFTQTDNILRIRNSDVNGLLVYRFNGSDKLVVDQNRMYPVVNATDNVSTTGYDLGIFSRHFRRVYTQGIHTNDNATDGGLRINIGSGGNTTADYMFSDFAHFPVADGVKNLGQSANSWNELYYRNAFRTSDRRKKSNIQKLSTGLETIKGLQTYQYTYTQDPKQRQQFGFIAQELQESIPSIVKVGEDMDKSLAVDYEQLIPVLVKAVQEQQLEIEALKKRLAELSE